MAKIVFPLPRANDRPLADRVAALGSFWADPAGCVDFVQRGFAQLGLPVPGAGEYIETVDCGHLAFITPAGCTIRLEAADPVNGAHVPGYDDLNSEFVLQPIGRIDGPGVSLCVYPGVDVPWMEVDSDGRDYVGDDLFRLDRRLSRDHLDIPAFDLRGDNIGYLPFTSPEWPRGVPVIIDPGAVQELSGDVVAVRNIVQVVKRVLGIRKNPLSYTSPVRQADLFSDLRNQFAYAMTQATDPERDAAMDDFWAACAAAKARGFLKSDWVTLPENFKNIPAAARQYERSVIAAVKGLQPPV